MVQAIIGSSETRLKCVMALRNRRDVGIEKIYGINRTFVRSVYALCTELKEPLDAVIFILRGIGSPKIEESLRELANEFCE